jgi:hypothetical protein
VRGRSRYWRLGYGVLPAVMLLGVPAFFAPRVQAAIPDIDIVFTLHASNDSGSGSYLVPFEQGEWDPNSETFTWFLPAPIDIRPDEEDGQTVATLLYADVLLCTKQLYKIDIDIQVLSGRSETTFVVTSPLLSFPTIPAEFAEAGATASFTVMDLEGDDACLTGLGPPGSGAFRSYYNGYLFDGTRFTHLVGRVFVSDGGIATASQSDPLFGFRSIDLDVYDMSTETAFTLTPNDYADAMTSTHMPEPDEGCFGDINGDRVIDAADVGELLAAYGTEIGDPGYNASADLDESGCIDLADVSELLAVYGQTCP